MLDNKQGAYTRWKKKGVISKESYVLDIKKYRGQEGTVKMWAALLFARHIKRHSQVPFN